MKITGIFLARNEEFFAERAIRNAIGFCDQFLAVDNGSTDRTPEILENLRREFPDKMVVHRAAHPGVSHDLIAPLAGTETWVFGVDGDEIYDPAGLARLRVRLEQGAFSRDWCVFGSVLNVKHLDEAARTAAGHLSPPCRSMTKLYNFAAIDAWHGPCQERLHGGTIDFRPGFDASMRRALNEEEPWDDADFRCLHLCFLPRSSFDAPGKIRRNIMDRHAWDAAKLLRRVVSALMFRTAPSWKDEKYARGPLVTKPVGGFFR